MRLSVTTGSNFIPHLQHLVGVVVAMSGEQILVAKWPLVRCLVEIKFLIM
jgi:hypothetical protein